MVAPPPGGGASTPPPGPAQRGVRGGGRVAAFVPPGEEQALPVPAQAEPVEPSRSVSFTRVGVEQPPALLIGIQVQDEPLLAAPRERLLQRQHRPAPASE